MAHAGNPLAGFLLLIRHALVVEAHFVGHGLFEDIFQCRGRLLRAITGRGAADDRRRPVLVVAQGEFRAITGLEVCERGKRHILSLTVAHVELPKVLRI